MKTICYFCLKFKDKPCSKKADADKLTMLQKAQVVRECRENEKEIKVKSNESKT